MTDADISDKPDAIAVETRSLTVSKWANLFMGACGILAAWLSNSEAIMLDGLFSGIGFLSAIFAARIRRSVDRPPDRRRPFGYAADEALYTTFRSLSLLGLILFALASALMRIATYALGGSVPELVFGPIIIYFLVICATCFGLATLHHVNWRRGGKTSEILKLEMQAAIVDGAITAGAGAGLLAIPFLEGTALQWIVPIGDSVVMVFLCGLITFHPVYSFRRSLAELAGISAGPDAVKAARRLVREIAGDRGMRVVDVSINRLGRSHTIVAYIDPETAITADAVDDLTRALDTAAAGTFSDVRIYVIVSRHDRAWNPRDNDGGADAASAAAD